MRKLKANYKVVILSLLAIALIATIPGFHWKESSGQAQATPEVQLQAANVTDPAFSEINVHIRGYYPQLDLYLRAPQNTAAPMLNDFQIEINSPGNSTVMVRTGTTLLTSATGWAYNKTLYINTTLSGTVTLNINVTSSELQHTSQFSYILDMMTPQQYINYESGKNKLLNLIPYSLLPEAFAAGAVTIWATARIFRKFLIKPHIEVKYDDRGLIRSG